MAIVVLSTAAGIGATRFVKPAYEVHASIMIASAGPMQDRTGPIRSAGLFDADDWVQLLRSFTIVDPVVLKLALYLHPANTVDRELFEGFALADQFVPGRYELVIDQTHRRWTLSLQASKALVDSGTATDSVGRKFGFLWQPPQWVFNSTGERKVRFTVTTPREASVNLINRLGTGRQEGSDFLKLTFQDPSPQLAARIVNTWVDEYVAVASSLKRQKLVEFTNILGGQLQTAQNALDGAEQNLSTFRVRTITEPHEASQGPIAAGLATTTDPVQKRYFEQKIEYENVKNDVASLQHILANPSSDSIPSDALLQIPSIAQGGPAAAALRDAFTDYHKAESNLSTQRLLYTDEHPTVKGLLSTMRVLKQEKIPRYAHDLLTSLRQRELDDSVRIAGASVNLQQIPQRTIEEERLRRIREGAAVLTSNLQNRYSEAQLAEASATPDVRMMDSAIAPLAPTANTAPRIVFMAILGGIGAALALAILLDKLDGRIRYPEQITDDLGLPIAGTVPRLPKRGLNRNSPEQMFQMVESFRSLRMAVMSGAGGPGVSVAVTSPAPSEGKSLISANLAMSFADAGLRTVLLDGDTRRGRLHTMFDAIPSPGLTDYLAGRASLADVVRPSGHDKLSIVPCGTRQRSSPELLTSPRLRGMVEELRRSYDVVLFDTPPLAAGIDAYSIASASGRLLVVIRVGQTQRRLAWEKLRMFERLPVDIIGAVLNGIRFEGGYEYYGYIPSYEAVDESPTTAVVRSN
jgi:capsular exopolysaccharide synthesis family protein